MKEATGVVENGTVRLLEPVPLADGTKVRILWEDRDNEPPVFLEREALTEEDVQADLRWATGKRFAP
jgi:hypothetical protein